MVDLNDLIIPVYLNQRVVFDLVAVLEGGIASVKQLSETHLETKGESKQIGVSFGLSNVLSSLLKVDLTGKKGNETSDKKSTTTTEDRIHTPVSLFVTLRSILQKNSYIKKVEFGVDVSPGDIVEFSSILNRNPLIETLDIFSELISLMEIVEEKHQKGKNKQNKEIDKVRKIINSLIESLKGGDTIDLTTPPLVSSHRAVISIEKQNLNDPSMSDLVDGTFVVIGKVTKSIKECEGSISLNRKSALNRFPPEILKQFESAFQSRELREMNLPELEWEVAGPAIQVLPIAIFV